MATSRGRGIPDIRIAGVCVRDRPRGAFPAREPGAHRHSGNVDTHDVGGLLDNGVHVAGLRPTLASPVDLDGNAISSSEVDAAFALHRRFSR